MELVYFIYEMTEDEVISHTKSSMKHVYVMELLVCVQFCLYSSFGDMDFQSEIFASKSDFI